MKKRQIIHRLISLIQSIHSRLCKEYTRFAIRKFKVAPAVYQYLTSADIPCIVFNLNSKINCRHGDTFFYVNAIKFLSTELSIPIIVKAHNFNHDLLSFSLPKNVNIVIGDSMVDGFQVYPIGCYRANRANQEFGFLVFDLHKYDYNATISDQILKSIKTLKNYYIQDTIECGSYVLVAPDVGSQSFMITSTKAKSLFDLAIMHANRNNCQLIVLSDTNYYASYKVVSPKNTGFSYVHSLIASDKCITVFTFDSFIMHYAHMLGKKTFVKFRGKLTHRQYTEHYRLVNNAFRKEVSYV